jgi:glycosyltransferase involved in cell wall biosynthesis
VVALSRDPSVIVTGYVRDMRPYMARAEVAIDPLRIGAGLQNKVLENMSMGLPLVMTTVANEGIRAVSERDALVADDPSAFARQVARLLNDGAQRQRLGAAAREFIIRGWSWDKHFHDLERIFSELVGRNPRLPAGARRSPMPGGELGIQPPGKCVPDYAVDATGG